MSRRAARRDRRPSGRPSDFTPRRQPALRRARPASARAPGTRRPALPRRAAADRSRRRGRARPASARACCAAACAAARTATATSSPSKAGVDLRGGHQRPHANHRRVHPRRRIEGFGRHVEHGLDRVAPLQHHAQAAEALAAGHGDHAIDHFLLQHEVLVHHVLDVREQVEQDRRRDVVGQVADDPKPAAQRSARARRSRPSAHRTRRPSSSLRWRRRAARSRSSSITVSRPQRATSGSVSAPSPGPISTSNSPRRGSIASTMASTMLSSARKCCPKRLRAMCLIAGRPRRAQYGGSRISM